MTADPRPVSPEAAPPRATTPHIEERIVRHPNGHLMVERAEFWTPSREQAAKWLASIMKAYPYLVKHADHIDGEFDLASTDLRDGIAAMHDQLDRLRAALASSQPAVSPSPAGPTPPMTDERLRIAVQRVLSLEALPASEVSAEEWREEFDRLRAALAGGPSPDGETPNA